MAGYGKLDSRSFDLHGRAEATKHLVEHYKHFAVDMWRVRQHLVETPDFRRSNIALLRYLFFLMTMIHFIDEMPWPSTQLKHQQALEDLLLDEEFPDVPNMKKTFQDVGSVEEMWQWARGPLSQAILADDSNPGSLVAMLGANQVVGPMRLRQARAKNMKERLTQSYMKGGSDGAACGAAAGSGGCCEARSSEECRFDFANGTWEDPGTPGWSKSSQHDRALYCVEYPHDLKCSSCDDLMHQKLAHGVFLEDCATDAPVHEPWSAYRPRGRVTPLKGARSFVDDNWGVDIDVFGDGSGDNLNVSKFKMDIDLNEIVKAATNVAWNGSSIPMTGIEYLQETLKDVEEGKRPFKVDIHTRAVAFQLVLYSGHHSTAGGTSDVANVLTWVEVIFFIEPSGQVAHHARITPMPVPNTCFLASNHHLQIMLLPTSVAARCFPDSIVRMCLAPFFSWDFCWLAFTVLGMGWLIVEEIQDLIDADSGVFAHFSSGSKFVELVFFTTFILVLFYMADYSDELSTAVDSVLLRPHEFTDLSFTRQAHRTFRNWIGFFLFVVVVKIAKFVRVTASLRVLWRTLEYAAVDLLFFGFNLVILLLAFSLCSLYVLGQSVVGYHNALASFTSWARMAVGEGDYNYHEMSSAWPFAIVFLLIFALLVMVVAMNTFIAILSSAYDDARSEAVDWVLSRQELRKYYLNDERGLYNEPQDLVDLYEMAQVMWKRFNVGMRTQVYSGYSLEHARKREDVHHLKVGHQVWIKLDSYVVPDNAAMLFGSDIPDSPDHILSTGFLGGLSNAAADEQSIEVNADRTPGYQKRDLRNGLQSEKEIFTEIEKEADLARRTKLFIRNRIDSLAFLEEIGSMRRVFKDILGNPADSADAQPTELRRTDSRALDALHAIESAAQVRPTFELRLNGEKHTVAHVRLRSMACTINDLDKHMDADGATEVFPGFVQLNHWMVTDVTTIDSWHDFHADDSEKTIRVRKNDKLYWLLTTATWLQLLRAKCLEYLLYIPLLLLRLIAWLVSFGVFILIERCCNVSQNSDNDRHQKLREAAVRFLRSRAKTLGKRNPHAGNVPKSMKFYAKHNMPLAELVAILEYETFCPPRAWRVDQRIYRHICAALGLGFANARRFDERDREMLYACFGDRELFRMNLLNYDVDNDDSGDESRVPNGQRTSWIDTQSQLHNTQHTMLRHLQDQLRAVVGEVQRISSTLGLPQDPKAHAVLMATTGDYSGGAMHRCLKQVVLHQRIESCWATAQMFRFESPQCRIAVLSRTIITRCHT